VRDLEAPAPGTYGVFLSTRNLAKKFTGEKKIERPFESVNGLCHFGRWLMDTDNAGSLDLRIRIGALLGRIDNPGITIDLTKDRSVKAVLKERDRRFGSDRGADTPLPLVMFTKVCARLRRRLRERLDSRLLLALIMEFMGGLRVGEAAGAGDRHGWQCGRRTRVFRDRVEVLLERSKASTAEEWVTVARHTEVSQVDLGAELKVHAKAWGLRWDAARSETGERYEFLDYAVARLSLDGFSAERMAEFEDHLRTQPGMSERVVSHLSGAAPRRRALHAGARYVNMAGGTLEELLPRAPVSERQPGPEQFWWRPCLMEGLGEPGAVGGLAAELKFGIRRPCPQLIWWLERGYDVRLLDGPMLGSTASGSRAQVITHMPWTPGSLAGELKEHFEAAFLEVLQGSNPDERGQLSSLPMGGMGGPKWASHSCRRGGCKLARELNLGVPGGASEEDINRHFRWHTAETKKDRQVSYAGMRDPSARVNVTRRF